MGERTENKSAGDDPEFTDTPDVSELDFAPDWARGDPRVQHRDYSEGAAGGNRARRDRKSRSPSGKGSRGEGKGPAENGGFRRSPRRKPREEPGTDNKPAHGGKRSMPERARPGEEAFPNRDRGTPRDIPVEIRFLPELKALGAIIHKIQASHYAYPLRDMARLFLDNDEACTVRLDAKTTQAESRISLFQCLKCGTPALEREELESHLLQEHLDEFFERVEERIDPPSGVFNCVARCGVTGELLGPPNHHTTQDRIKEILRTRCSSMTEEVYRSRLEMCYDEDLIAKWREQACVRERYRRKSDRPENTSTPPQSESGEPPAEHTTEEGPSEGTENRLVELQQAEFVFRRELAPGLIRAVNRLTCPLSAAKKTPSDSLREVMRLAWHKEKNFPASLTFALRGAFRHKGLHLFKANESRGPEFVIARSFSILDPDHAVPEIRSILEYVDKHHGCTPREWIEEQIRDAALESDSKHLQSQVRWLVEKGHLIMYFNGMLALPATHPFFKNKESDP